MDSDTEIVGTAGRRSHHSLEDALKMDELVSLEEPVFEVPELRDTSPQIRAAFRWMDTVDVEELFRRRAAVLRSVPHFLRGPFRVALHMAMAEAIATEHVRQARGWKLFLLLRRMLLSRPLRGGYVRKEKLRKRFELFSAGRWQELLADSMRIADEASNAMHRRRRRTNADDSDRRAARVHAWVQLGELSAVRVALEAAELALGPNTTYRALTDPRRRPLRPREPISDHFLNMNPAAFELDEGMFANVRSAQKGAAPGPSGMAVEHLRPLLDNLRDVHMFFLMAEQLVQGRAPEVAVQAIRLGRLTALRKPDGGVRSIVVGDVVRRLVSRTVAQQLGEAVKLATSPFQYALSTRAGCECIAHALQALTEANPEATILSVDGIGAFDLVSRGAMLQGLCDVHQQCRLFVNSMEPRPVILWDNDSREVHDIDQGEGGEQGDPLMPMLFSLG